MTAAGFSKYKDSGNPRIATLLSNLNSRDFVLFCSTLQNNKEFHPWVGSWDWTKFVCSLEKDVWNKLFTRSFILISSIINT